MSRYKQNPYNIITLKEGFINSLIKKVEYVKNSILLKELIVSTYKKYSNNYHHIITLYKKNII